MCLEYFITSFLWGCTMQSVLMYEQIDWSQGCSKSEKLGLLYTYNLSAHKVTPARTLSISALKSRVLKLSFLSLKMMVKSGLEFILKLTEPLQNCCCPVQKYLPRMAELAWQLSRYLWRGSVNFKINSRPIFSIIFKLINDNFKTRDFSPLIERVLAGVNCYHLLKMKRVIDIHHCRYELLLDFILILKSLWLAIPKIPAGTHQHLFAVLICVKMWLFLGSGPIVALWQ